MSDSTELLAKVAAEVATEAYSDAVSGAFREAGKVGEDLVKTVRLILFPFQYTAMLQDRLARHIKRALERVPVEDRIRPVESIAIPVAERLRVEVDDSLIGEMYVNLLARAMNRVHVGEAHPAFVHVIGQLAPDEGLLIEQLARESVAVYTRVPGCNAAMLEAERTRAIETSNLWGEAKARIARIAVQPERLGQPDLVFTYIEHLVSLGLVSYTNEPWHSEFEGAKLNGCDFWFIHMNGFGNLFHKA
ncbi:Abi-alpha family protein [Ralstonia solanacearum]|uniref:Abi-alpha family protein n=1 Tax=Ralstonia solanacearum TaxID=305 RepID=UPI0023DAB6CF|nr:Abi-alpha family protein [Ralstonia solanacearum]